MRDAPFFPQANREALFLKEDGASETADVTLIQDVMEDYAEEVSHWVGVGVISSRVVRR